MKSASFSIILLAVAILLLVYELHGHDKRIRDLEHEVKSLRENKSLTLDK